MNEIKQVVNNNYNEVGNISGLNTSDKTSVVNAINEVSDKIKDTGWNTASLNTGFTHSALASAGDLMYRRIGNVVYIKGSVKGFTSSSTVCTQLPNGYRPPSRIDFYGSESGNYIAKFIVGADGGISYLGGTRGSVAATQWFNLCTSYITDETFPV